MRRLVWTLFWTVLLTQGLMASDVTVSFDAEDPPFMYEGPTHTPSGLYPLLFAEAFSRMGVQASFQSLPWKRALEGLDKGVHGVGGIYQTQERLAKYDYSAPFYQERIAVYEPVSGGFSFSSLADLSGKRVAVIRGWSYGDAFDAAVKAGKIAVEESQGDAANFKKLSAGRVDVVLAIWEAGDQEVATQGLDTIRRMPTLLTTNNVYLAFLKTSGKKDLLGQFDTAMAAMKKDGSFGAIVKRAFRN